MTTLGLFRWDPLTGTGTTTGVGDMGADNRAWLGPNQFHGRAPIFMTLGNNTVSGRSDTQACCDDQITFAYKAGFDYFAYAFQPDQQNFFSGGGSDPRSNWIDANAAMTLHRSSSIKSMMKWCLNVVMDRGAGTAKFGDGNTWAVVRDYIAAAMQDPDYMTVLSGRPLLFLYMCDDFVSINCGGSTVNATNSLNGIRTIVQAAIGKDPYMVSLGVSSGPTHVSDIGVNAAGRYSVLASGTPETYATFKTRMEGTWATDAAAYTNIVPNCSMGIDYTPIFTTPILNSYAPPGNGPEGDPGPVCLAPTYAESAAHIQAAIDYVAANPTKCPADTVCIYNWSEPTECGAGLWPTWGDRGLRSLTIGQTLGRQRVFPVAHLPHYS